MKLFISIPAYNEEKTITPLIRTITTTLKKTNNPYTIHVTDDGSTDATATLARQAGATVHPHLGNFGLAETFRTEIKHFLKSDADVFVHIDADGQYNPTDIPKLLTAIEHGADLALGNRFQGGIQSMPLIKRIGNKTFSRVISKITKQPIGDAQTGFRAFTKKVAQLPITSTHTYTQEQIIRAAREGYTITEVPTYFSQRNDKSRLLKNPFEYATKAWINILRIYRDYEPLKFFGKIGTTLITIGALTGLWLVYNVLTTGRIGHLPLTILTMLLILTGVQIILFGFLADMHRK